MREKPCPRCGETATEVIYAAENVRRGWYCPHCGHFDKAIGRERKWTDHKPDRRPS